MHWLRRLRAASWVQARRRLGWRNPVAHDIVLIVASAAGIYAFSHYFDLPPKLFQLGLDYSDWGMDDIIFVLFVMSIVFVILSFHRTSVLSQEIEARRTAEMEACKLARHDPMTGLPNRRMFNEELDRRLAEAANKGEALASFILDLDRMRVVNDTYGHETGDHVLQEIANRMRAGINAEDFVARVGGDEFGVLVSSPGSEAFIELAERLLQTIEKPIMCEGIGLVTTASIGIAVYPNDGETGNALLQSADIAMYQAKARGRNVHAFFDKTLDEAVRQRRELELDLRCAIRNGQIVPFYQPIISFATGAIVGVETLARWQHPTKGLIGADKFISLAEDTGQVSGLFGAILKKACLDAKEWGSSITVAVNVSPVQFSDLGLVGQIFEILKETKFPIGALDLEVTESAVLDNNKAKAVLGILKRKGVRISLDDFGTGYSSLSCLNDLPFDRIKIDRSFLRTRERSSKSERLVASIITLSHTLGLTTIAEGVESAADAAWLMRNNCEFGQGYYFSPPVPADQVSDLLKTTAPWAATKLKPEGRFA